jgi:hypothetical protein
MKIEYESEQLCFTPANSGRAMLRRMAVLCGAAEDETIFMQHMKDASAFEVISADAAEVWRAGRPPQQDPHSAEQVAMDHLKGISEMCLMDECAAFVWVQSDRSALANFIATLLAAELLGTARLPPFIS